jgi:hypothetical protein
MLFMTPLVAPGTNRPMYHAAVVLRRHLTEYFVNAPPAWTSEFGPSAA